MNGSCSHMPLSNYLQKTFFVHVDHVSPYHTLNNHDESYTKEMRTIPDMLVLLYL